jgi:hypothetical protein
MDSLSIRPVAVKTVDYEIQYEKLMSKKRALDLQYYNVMNALTKGATDKESTYNLILKKMLDVENELNELFSKQNFGSYKGHYVVLEAAGAMRSPIVKVDRDPVIRKENHTHKKPLSPEQKAKLLQLNAAALAKAGFKFKTLAECKSQARTKPFYMAKDELIKTIERDEELRKKMPPKYKSMKKEEICEALVKA